MATNRMNREQFYAKLAGRDADELAKVLWTLYWRGSAPMRERIEAALDPEVRTRQQRQKDAPPSGAEVWDEVMAFAELARSGAYLGSDRRVTPKERSRWRFTFRRLVKDAEAALAGDGIDAAADAVDLLVDIACESRDYHYFRSEDPMQAAGVVVSDVVAALWRAVLDRQGFAEFAASAAPQLLRWEAGYGWTRQGWGSVADKETSLADVLVPLLTVPDHWSTFATSYLAALDEEADRMDGVRESSRRYQQQSRASALAQWHAELLDRLTGTEHEDLLDRLITHRALGGGQLSFLAAQLAHRRGDADQARTLIHQALEQLPGHDGMHDFAERIGAPLPERAGQARSRLR